MNKRNIKQLLRQCRAIGTADDYQALVDSVGQRLEAFITERRPVTADAPIEPAETADA